MQGPSPSSMSKQLTCGTPLHISFSATDI